VDDSSASRSPSQSTRQNARATRTMSDDERRGDRDGERRGDRDDERRGDRNGGDRGGERSESRREEGVSVLVRNLTFKLSKEDLREEFEKFGSVKDVYIPLDYMTREPRGFAFIEMSCKAEADEAISALDGKDLDGRVIKVLLAAQKRKRPEEMARVDPRSQGGGRRGPPGGRYDDRRRSPPRRRYDDDYRRGGGGGGGRYDDRRRSRSRSRSFERRRDDRRRRDDDRDEAPRRRRDRSRSRSKSASRSPSRRRD
jgi:RNA recognition motif-containing protein